MIALITAVTYACSGATERSSPAPSRDPAPERNHVRSHGRESLPGRPVTLAAADAVRLEAQLLAASDSWVILAHMGNAGDSLLDWLPAAEHLHDLDFTVLLINRRGVCLPAGDRCSEGPDDFAASWADVVGAAEYAEQHGAARIVIGGASLGAMASLYAARRLGDRIDGVIWLAGLLDASGYRFSARSVHATAAPVLAISATNDPYGAAHDARELARWSGEGSPVLIRGSSHGTDMLRQEQPRRRLMEAIEAFLAGPKSTRRRHGTDRHEATPPTSEPGRYR